MKKILALFIAITLLLATFLIVSSCGSDDFIEPGNYIFEKSSYDYFVSLDVNGKNKTSWSEDFKNGQNSYNFNIKIEPKNNGYEFNDCSITILLKANNSEQTENINIFDGYGSFNGTVEFAPSYSAEISYEVVSAEGTVYVPISEKYTLNDYNYSLSLSETDNEWVCTISDFGKHNIKEVVIYDTYDIGNVFDARLIKCGRIFTSLNPEKSSCRIGCGNFLNCAGCDFGIPGTGCGYNETTAETIIFDGEFDIADMFYRTDNYFSYEKLKDDTYWANIKDNFPKLKTIVIKKLYGTLFDVIPQINLPEKGITIYVDDYTENEEFTNILRNTMFINGVYSYSDYNG